MSVLRRAYDPVLLGASAHARAPSPEIPRVPELLQLGPCAGLLLGLLLPETNIFAAKERESLGDW